MAVANVTVKRATFCVKNIAEIPQWTGAERNGYLLNSTTYFASVSRATTENPFLAQPYNDRPYRTLYVTNTSASRVLIALNTAKDNCIIVPANSIRELSMTNKAFYNILEIMPLDSDINTGELIIEGGM